MAAAAARKLQKEVEVVLKKGLMAELLIFPKKSIR